MRPCRLTQNRAPTVPLILVVVRHLSGQNRTLRCKRTLCPRYLSRTGLRVRPAPPFTTKQTADENKTVPESHIRVHVVPHDHDEQRVGCNLQTTSTLVCTGDTVRGPLSEESLYAT